MQTIYCAVIFAANTFGLIYSVVNYLKLKKILKYLKNVIVIDLLDADSAAKVVLGGNELVAASGDVVNLGKLIESQASPGIFGVIYRQKLIEHYLTRSTMGFWDCKKNVIQDHFSVVPFAIVGNKLSIEILEPLSATILHLKEVSNQYFENKTGYMDYLSTFLFGYRIKGLQTIEEMLLAKTRLLAVGELADKGGKFVLQPPKDGPFILTHLSLPTMIKKLSSDRTFYLALSAIFGTSTLIVAVVLFRKYFKVWRFKSQVREVMKNRSTSVNLDTVPDELLCVVCKVNQKEIMLLNCNHLCLCVNCSDRINDTCPICRAVIFQKTVAFI